MNAVTHQTVKLARGKHSSPEYGACVMELASMLAGEPFSDHPKSVSRPIASFLRGYNDILDDRRRQDLYAFAAASVGSVASDEVEKLRAERLIAWADALGPQKPRWLHVRRMRRRSVLRERGRTDPEAAAEYAVRALGEISDERHAAVCSLVDELIAMAAAPERRCIRTATSARRRPGAQQDTARLI